MAEENATTPDVQSTEEADSAAASPTASPTASPEKTFTQTDFDRIVGERVAKERQKFADYGDLKAKAQQLEELEAAQQSDMDKLTGERDTLRTRADEAAVENLRLRVAVEKGLVGERAWIAERLRGNTEEEMSADADQFLERVAVKPQESPSPDLHGGARPQAPQADEDAQYAAYMRQHFPGAVRPPDTT